LIDGPTGREPLGTMPRAPAWVHWILAVLVFCIVPAPVYAVFCLGLLPLGAQLILLPKAGPLLVFLLPSVLLSAILMYWPTSFLLRRVQTMRAGVLVALGIAVLGALPVYPFDCMDGGSLTWCSAYQRYAGLPTHSNSCTEP
jgi:hypothetical protein